MKTNNGAIGSVITIVGLATMAVGVFQNVLVFMYAGGVLFLLGQTITAPTRISMKPAPLKPTGYPWPTEASRALLLNLGLAGICFFAYINATEEKNKTFQAMIVGVFLIYALIEAVRDYRWRGPRER